MINAFKAKPHKCLSRIAAHQSAGIVESQVIAVVLHLYFLKCRNSRCCTIECQTDSVKNGCLAGTRITCYKKDIAVDQRRLREIYNLVFDGSYVVYMQFLYFHGSIRFQNYS